MFELTEKRALVCGGSRGIGRACAEALAAHGADVTLVARDAALLEGVCAALPARAAQRHQFVAADFGDHAALRRSMESHVAKSGPYHILVNNTGGPHGGPLLDTAAEEFTRAYEMHVLCNHALVQTLVPGMKALAYGRIINIISTSVREPIPGLGVSNTTRWAVAAWAKTLSRELAPLGITINNVLPGYTDTDRLRELFESRGRRDGRSAEQVADETRRAIPMGRFARPAEIAAAVAFLASAEASYVTGINLPVDGGRLSSM